MSDASNQKPKRDTSAYWKAYYAANREAIAEKRRAYRIANREKIAIRQRVYLAKNADRLAAKRQENAEHRKEKNRAYYAANRELCKKRAQEWRARNPEAVAKANAAWRKNNKQRVRQHYLDHKAERHRWHYQYQRDKAARDPSFAVYRRVMAWMSRAAAKHKEGRNVTSASKIVQLLACEWAEFVAHVERQFQPGMTWGNHGRSGWHFDHIIPLSSFDLTDETQLRKACHYTNVQPLWAADNVRKGAKIA